MRPLNLNDFIKTGWNYNNPTVKALVDGILATQGAVFQKYGITKGIHVVHLMAQLSHESGEGTEMVESLNYAPAKLLSQWKTHFTPATAQKYGRTAEHPANQIAIGNIAYGGRMGNRKAPNPEVADDGFNFRGRGFIQTTGKDGYQDIQKLTGLDVIAHPEYLTDPAHAFEVAVAEFVNYRNMLAYCEADNLRAVSGSINVGNPNAPANKIIGLDDRAAQLRLWKHQYELA